MPFTLPLPLRRLRVLAALLLACVLAALVLSISPARASAQPAPDASSSPAVAQSFGYSGSVQTYTVPAGVNSLQVSATGGSGTGYYHADGGAGGTVNATIPATPGQTLDIYVGGNGGTPNGYSAPGGYNGGGSSGPFAGSGGGATDIRTSQNDLSSRILVAGGGGGAGPGNGAGNDAPGGNAGYPAGADGSSSYGTPGGGGTQQTGGAGGPSSGGGYQGGTYGGFGSGGTGAFSGGTGGGGGGGGYYGGGGASGSSGGGGGSDYVAGGAYNTTYSTGGGAGVTITPVSSAIAVTPDNQDFGSVVVGQSSSAHTFTVTNNGSATANVSSVALSGANTGSFSISADTCTGTAVAAGATCTVNVTFTPTSPASAGNAEQYAELDVASDSGGYGAALQGQGMIQPVMMASPSSWNFGTVTDGTSQTMQLRVYNESSTSFNARPTISGDTNHEYQVMSSMSGYCGNFYTYFRAYGECTFDVTFTPNTADTAENATLTIANVDSTVGGSVSISLTGTGQSLPAISVPATPTDFGSVNAGDTGTQTVTVTNTGDEALTPGASTLTGANAARYSISSDGCSGQSLAKNATCAISLAFSPTAPGAQTATLNIPNNDPTQAGGTTAVNLTGTGVAGTLSVSPSPANFGPVNEGQTATKTFTVSDTGAGTVNIAADTLSGAHASEFAISSDTCANTTLTPTGATSSCTITASYTASTRGSVAAELDIASDAGNATAGNTPVALSGTGLAPADISATPANQDFGSVTEGQDSAPAMFTVTNTGDQPLNVGAASINGVDASQFVIVPGHDNCSNTAVAGSGTCTLQVEFDPTAHGQQGATLTIASNATSGSPVTISLLGSGLAPGDATVSPSFGYYGALSTGQAPATKTFTLTNPGDNALHTGAATITGSAAADFSIVNGSDSCSNQTIAGGATCSVTVALATEGRGARQATLSIPSDAASGAVTTVGLAGDVLAPAGAFVDHSGKDFGAVTTGDSAARTVTLLNSCDQTLSIGRMSLTGADAGDFTIVTAQDGCSGESLAGGATCTAGVRFAPSHARAETANLSIPSNDPNSPTLVTLTGTGQAPAPTPTPTPTATPTPSPTPAPTPAPPTVTAPTLSSSGLTVQAGTSNSQAGVTLQLSAPGTVSATVTRYENGKWVAVGTETITAPKAGHVHLALGSRFSGHALAPGTYRVTITAASGGQTSKPLNLPLTVTPANGPHGQPRLLSVALLAKTLVWTAGRPAPKLWLTFTASRAALLQVSMQVKVRDAWQQVALTTTNVKAGPGRVQLVGRWGGLLVPARDIRLVVHASAASMQSASKTLNVHIRHAA
jgi:Glycine rich protein/Abnormal spindle-like microcephaly-assoc'd, ASPM-SPD-2-Hydin